MTEVRCVSCDKNLGRVVGTRIPKMLCMKSVCSWPDPNSKRNTVIVKARKEGKSVTKIAAEHEMTRQRVYQILNDKLEGSTNN